MNISVRILCLLTIASARNLDSVSLQEHPRFVSPGSIIRKGFEMLRWLIKNGSHDVIPVMDPWEFDSQSFHVRALNKLLTLDVNFTKGILIGLGDFEVIEAELVKCNISVDFSINFPLLIFSAEQYEMEGNVFEVIPLAGHGRFEFEVRNFNLKSKIILKQSDDGQSVVIDKFFDPEFSIEKILSRTDFDDNIDDIFNALVEDLLAEHLTLFSKLILSKYLATVAESANPFLNEFDTWAIIETIL